MKKGCTINKRGYFFIIDSILALGVLSIGAFLVFTSYVEITPKDKVTILSEDIMDFFANNRIKDVNNEYAGIGGELWNSGSITNADNSLLQQVAEFYTKSNFDTAEQFIENFTINLMPSQFSFELWLDDTLMYPQDPSPEHIKSKNAAKILIPSKKIVHGILNKETGELFGPYKTEVLVWQKTG